MDKYQLYDLAISKACVNFNSLAQRNGGHIYLGGFDPKNEAHLCALKCAEIVQNNFEADYDLFVEDKFWAHLFAPKWVRAHKRKKMIDGAVDTAEFINFTMTGLEGFDFSDIYKEYYK